MGSNYMGVLHKAVCKDLWDLEDRQVLEVLDRHRTADLVVLVRPRRRINRMLGRMSVHQVVAVHPHKGKRKRKDKDKVDRDLRAKVSTAIDLGMALGGEQGVEGDLKQAGKADRRDTLDILRAEVSRISTDTSQGSNRHIGSSSVLYV